MFYVSLHKCLYIWYGMVWYLWYVVYCVSVVNAFGVLHGCESNLDLRLACNEKMTELHSITRKAKIV